MKAKMKWEQGKNKEDLELLIGKQWTTYTNKHNKKINKNAHEKTQAHNQAWKMNAKKISKSWPYPKACNKLMKNRAK